MADRETVMSHLEKLPDEAMDEIIDFLAEKRGYVKQDSNLLRLQESSMTSVWSTPEDEDWNDVPSR